MIKIYLDLNDGFFHFKINNSKVFDDLVCFFKQNYVKFDQRTKSYIEEPSLSARNIYDKLKGYDDIDISDEDVDMLIHTDYPPSNELKKIKFSVDKKLIEEHPPLKGIAPNEDYQMVAIKKVVQRNRNLFNIQCRYGKSFISIIGFSTLMNLNALDRVLIVCRPEGMINYKSEILRFNSNILEDDIEIITKDNRCIEDFFNKKIIILSYNTFRLSCQYYMKERNIKSKLPKKPMIDFSKWGKNRMIILDECQSINNDSAQTHFIQIHRDYFDYRLCMSGSLGYAFEKLYQQVKFLTPKRMPYSFKEWYNFITEQGHFKWDRKVIPQRLNEFVEQVLNPLMTTFTNCLPQPKNDEKIVYVDMSEKMRNYYQQYCNDTIQDVFKMGNGKIMLHALKIKFPYLKNITDDLSLMNVSSWNMEKDNPKIDVLNSLLERLIKDENKKVILWCNSPKSMQMLNKIYAKYNPICIHGDEQLCGIKRDERNEWVKRAREDKDIKLLISNQVLSTSITLTEFKAQIWWSLPLNADYLHQANQRIQGPTQKDNIETIYLLFAKSIDNYIYNDIIKNRLGKKEFLDNSDKEISMLELKEIFNPKKMFTVEGELQ